MSLCCRRQEPEGGFSGCAWRPSAHNRALGEELEHHPAVAQPAIPAELKSSCHLCGTCCKGLQWHKSGNK